MSTGIGDSLREAREAQGRTLEDAARVVRARAGQLQALEEERFDAFGGTVYAKGFLKSYAQELGLDPDPLMDAFREHLGEQQPASVSGGMVKPVKTPGPKGTTPPAWAAWVLVAGVVVAGLFFLGLIFPPSAPTPAGEEAVTGPPVSPAPQEEPEEDGEEEPAEEPAPEPEPEPAPEPEEPEEPEFEGVEVILALERRSWLRVTVDGAVILEETVPEGETLRYEGDEVVVRIGDAGGVRTVWNGEDMGAAGSSGEVIELRFTEDGVETV